MFRRIFKSINNWVRRVHLRRKYLYTSMFKVNRVTNLTSYES